MSVEGIRKTLWEDDNWMKGLDRLESSLQPGGKIATPDRLPLVVFQESHLCFSGKQQVIESETWRGMRWIGWYAQDCTGGPISDPEPMNYVFEAISRDGRYFILLFANIGYIHPTPDWNRILKQEDAKSSKLVNPLPVGRERSQAIDALDEEENRLLRQSVSFHLDQAPPNSFNPELRQLDAAVDSIKLR